MLVMLLYHLPQDMICYVNVVVSPTAGYDVMLMLCYQLPQDMICYVNVVLSPTAGYDMLCKCCCITYRRIWYVM